MIGVGILHLAAPAGFVKIVPRALPWPLAVVYLSGFFEILLGIGLFVERLRAAAGWGLAALYLAVFPANINMALNDIQPGSSHIPRALLWARLPLQGALIFLAWWVSRPAPKPPRRKPGAGA